MLKTIYDKLVSIFSKKEDFSHMRNVVRDVHMHSFGSSVFDYGFMMSLDEKEYPKYLSKAFYVQMGKNLNLRNPKTLSEKIQWLKLNDNIPQKTELTDKILVRDYVAKSIGGGYLKPLLQVCNSFEEIDFNKLPNLLLLSAITVVNGNI